MASISRKIPDDSKKQLLLKIFQKFPQKVFQKSHLIDMKNSTFNSLKLTELNDINLIVLRLIPGGRL